MILRPKDWNVVVVGRWNRAILTPSGIAKRLFELPEGTPVEVHVPLDAIAPYQVKHKETTVVAGSDRLIVQPAECRFDLLETAKEIAAKAISNLRETPLTAAGINVVYVTEWSAPQKLIHML